MTAIDWETRLRRRRAALDRAERALEEDITDANREGGLSWRRIGAAASVNHERARQIADRVAQERSGAT